MRKNLFTCLFIIGIIASFTSSVYAQTWFNNNWIYRCPVTINNPGETELIDFQIRIDLNNSNFNFSHANTNGSDIRITASDEITEIPFWFEEWNPDENRANVWVKVPSIPVSGTTIYLYYGNLTASSFTNGFNTFQAYDGFETYAIGSVPGSNHINPGEWTRYTGNPLLLPGTPGSWDAQGATFASVIYDDRVGEYRMYYHGYNSSYHQVGLATSPDGLTWTKYSGNPIVQVTPGAWDRTGVRVPMVWKEGPTDYRMIYTGSGSASGQIGYATSSDGINWTKYAGNPVFNDPTWARNQTENWGVIKVGNEYLMWYSTWGQRQSGIAVSTDLINWTPHTPGPIFTSNGIPGDDRYSQFCPFTFKYNDYYYVLVPSYSSVGDYSKFYLYKSSSPYFPEADRTLVRVAHTPQGIDAKDNDTPFVLTLDIERSIFPNNELWVYYAADQGAGSWTWSECLLIEPDIEDALSPALLPTPGNLNWTKGGTGSVSVINDRVRSGNQSLRLVNSASLSGSFAQLSQGVVGAWMRRSSDNLINDFDIYLYDVSGSLNCVAGLGRDGYFHYWNGSFTSTGISYNMDSWYLVTLEFNCTTDRYNFVVYDSSLLQILRVDNIGFGNAANSTAINRAVLYTGGTYSGNAMADDFRVYKWTGASIVTNVEEEENNPLPVELASFSASVNGSIVKLDWRTETEVNNYGFEIQRKVNTDKEWTVIGFVNGNGNSNTPNTYSFEDKDLITGRYLYRLKQIDNDGKFEYSKTIEVNFGIADKFELSQNYPNPFNPTTSIQYTVGNRQLVTLKVFDVLGNEVATLVNEEKEAGIHNVQFSMNNLSSGVYIYTIKSGSFIQSRKMLYMK